LGERIKESELVKLLQVVEWPQDTMKVKMDKQGKGKKKENVLNLWKMILTTIYIINV